jgi:hypothetical protein
LFMSPTLGGDPKGLDCDVASVTNRLPDREIVLASYHEGVLAIEQATAIADWDAPTPCVEWRAVELVGHLLAVIRYYHRLLDSASVGRPIVDLPRGEQLAVMNANELSGLIAGSGVERTRQFVGLANDYATRLRKVDWDVTLGTWVGLGDLTIEEHTGVILGEWHVHAWDLARSAGVDHRPSDSVTVANGQGAVLRAVGPGDPWVEVLRGYGRDPDWSRPSDGV